MSKSRIVRSAAGLVLILACLVLTADCLRKPAPAGEAYGEGIVENEVVAEYGALRFKASPRPPAQLRDERASGGFDELWIIARGGFETTPDETSPGSGELRTRDPDSGEVIPVPLEHTDVRASIEGTIATVHVTQHYHNLFDRKIEAVYVFPLPQDAAVSDFLMVIGERRIRGIIREREEAEAIYADARRQGHVASLLTQERPNVFTQKVANIEPGKKIDVDLTYYSQLVLRDGSYRFVFPMVVGPRYNPPGHMTGVGAVGRDEGSRQPTAVPYLRPGERSGHDLSMTVALDTGIDIVDLKSTTHAIETVTESRGRAVVRLAERAVIPNRDFVLQFRLPGRSVQAVLLEHEDPTGSYFSIELHPPSDLSFVGRSPRELIFVLDCSGSMRGEPLQAAKRAVERVLGRMEPSDTFQIIRFSDSASRFGPRPLPATAENVSRAIEYLRDLDASGGTRMLEGIKAALDFPHQPGAVRLVTFMTDGFIGNEDDILRAIQRRLGSSRIFSFGVGSSPNRYLLDRMATMGRGAVAYVGLNDRASDEVVDAFFERIAHPALSEITIDWGSMEVEELYPARVPDLFVGRPVVLSGRFEGPVPDRIWIHAREEGRETTIELPLYALKRGDRPALARLWARRKIADLAMRAAYEKNLDELREEIKATALSYGLISAYTAFVAVDASDVTSGPEDVTVPVPVPVPDGVDYDTTVGSES